MECHSEFVEALGNNALSYRTVVRWVGKFQQGRVSTSDKQRSGRPLIVRTDLARAAVKALKGIYGNLYSEKNVCISSTHTHAGPGGFLQYALYIVTSQGFIRQTFDSIIEGIVKSVKMAHQNMQPGYIFWNEGDLFNASINRSPTSYLNNPPEERENYKTNVDTNMLLLKFTDLNRKPIGMINWFAVHCTSMNNTNKLISSDNKGYASVLFEQKMNGKVPIGKGPFVAAFAQANEGDVSPNTKGARCIDTGLPCDVNTSTCNGQNEKCIAFGPGKDMFESTEIIARKQFEKAVELFESANSPISGPIGFAHQFIDMSNQTVRLNKTANATTCKPAMGYSFAAGTTDGPGGFDFKQVGFFIQKCLFVLVSIYQIIRFALLMKMFYSPSYL
ncbi:neutral ceramidase B [Trichonephila clavata]|uniref:Neutral ceramidase n=1 Tax=Trichonephila clavata TaxID=2740835 RepID=A0A8X6L3I7_TRICU|nr:neutral ceramidase B [Trichonephila clavata]